MEKLEVAIAKVESVAVSNLTMLLAANQQDRPELARIVRRSWSDSNSPTSELDFVRSLRIVQGFVRAIEANGINSEFAVEMLEEIVIGPPSPLSDTAFKILERAILRGTSGVKQAQLRWRNSSNEKLRSLADKKTVRN
ncbi:MAG: hypothetical protein ACK6DZ_01455 [Acidobacteriota bacterium]